FATDKTHEVKKQNKRTKASRHYDVNTRAAMGALNAGVGNTHINKVLASLNIPALHVNSYKTHETSRYCSRRNGSRKLHYSDSYGAGTIYSERQQIKKSSVSFPCQRASINI
ncbi:hypothetical protein PV326_001393, partial [Microctonus aethiopoides]